MGATLNDSKSADVASDRPPREQYANQRRREPRGSVLAATILVVDALLFLELVRHLFFPHLAWWQQWVMSAVAAATATALGTYYAVLGTNNGPNAGKRIGMVRAISNDSGRSQTESQLREANRRLTEHIREMSRRSAEIEALGELGRSLQACGTTQELFVAVRAAAQHLFPGWSGAVYRIDPDRNALAAVAVWGELLGDGRIFSFDECWETLRSQPPVAVSQEENVTQSEKDATFPGDFIRVPLMAHGNSLGLFSLWRSNAPGQANAEDLPSLKTSRKLAAVVAEQAGLALANLELRETLRQQSTRDPLTGLFNRRYMEESMERELSRANRQQSSFAILLLDLDHFKEFNDTFGHPAGDAALRTLGDFLRDTSRRQDIACRYGGEEFALVLSDTTVEGAFRRAEFVREGIKELVVEYEGKRLGSLSASIGLAVYPDYGSTIDELLRVADQALYKAKREGRDRVSV